MNQINKVSDISYQDLAEYIRIDEVDSEEINFLNTAKSTAEAFIRSYTGRDDLDAFPDFVQIVFLLVQDMYDHRTIYSDKSQLNHVYETILGMHAVNLL